jgi:pyruvate formate lyase activating enzyme
MLKKLLDEELLDYVAMDIKNSPEKYAMTIGKDKIDLTPIRESISLIMGSKIDHEFRTTVVKEFHKISDLEEIGAMIRGAKRYFIQPFTDRDTVPFGNLHAPDKGDLEAYLALVRRYVPNAELRGID